jgi:hypothetical protein
MSEKILKLDELVFRKDLYPRSRGGTWWQTSYKYAQEMKAGAKFPAITVGRFSDSLIVVDGWHRCEALRLNREQYVKAVVKDYDSERDLFIDAVKLNLTHGMNLTSQDKSRIIYKLTEFSLQREEISSLIQIPIDKLKKFEFRAIQGPRGIVYLKSPVSKMLGDGSIDKETALNLDQSLLSTRTVRDLLEQLIALLRGDAFPLDDPGIRELSREIVDLLGDKLTMEEEA